MHNDNNDDLIFTLILCIMLSDLSRMYKLLKHIPTGLRVMVTELEQHVTETGILTTFLLQMQWLAFCDQKQ